MEFLNLGYGKKSDIIAGLPGGSVVIRDDDAAQVGAPCWVSATGKMEDVVSAYESAGGTVSETFITKGEKQWVILK